jgi:hypothetical protein
MQIKEIINAGLNAPLDTALMLERKAFQLQFATRDQKEGMRPSWKKENQNSKGSNAWRSIFPGRSCRRGVWHRHNGSRHRSIMCTSRAHDPVV